MSLENAVIELNNTMTKLAEFFARILQKCEDEEGVDESGPDESGQEAAGPEASFQQGDPHTWTREALKNYLNDHKVRFKDAARNPTLAALVLEVMAAKESTPAAPTEESTPATPAAATTAAATTEAAPAAISDEDLRVTLTKLSGVVGKEETKKIILEVGGAEKLKDVAPGKRVALYEFATQKLANGDDL